MKHLISCAALSLALVACNGDGNTADEIAFDTPVTVLRAETIYTGTSETPDASAIIIGADGRILMTLPLGSEASIIAPAVTDLSFDGVMYPGFVDGHAHLSGIGARELTIDLAGTASLAELLTRMGAEVDGVPSGQVVFGRGWIETGWPEDRMPNAGDLDQVSTDHPIILIRADGHALVANTAAMDAAGVTNDTPNPDGGAIERDATGAATGIFIDAAMGQIGALVDEPSDADKATFLQTGAEVFASRGWTGLHNMSVGPEEAPLMEALSKAGNLPQRVHNFYGADGFDIAEARTFETPTIQNRGIKIYMDGALGSRGALLFAPYEDRPDTTGLSMRGEAETAAVLDRAMAGNVQMAVHAIGDKANYDALSWMGAALDGAPDRRWRIEHAQIIRPQDIPAFARTGIIASMQPSHAIGDLKFAPDRLGPDRLDGAYAWQTVLDEGGIVVGGSDAPVEVGSPTIEFYAAVARKALDGSSGEGWHPEEAVSRAAALAMFTSAPAFASFQEDDLGTLEAGKLADITVFDRDLMTVPVAEILDAKPVATLIAGEVVWSAE